MAKRRRSPSTRPTNEKLILVPFLAGGEVVRVPWHSLAAAGEGTLLARSAAAALPFLAGNPPTSLNSGCECDLLPLVPCSGGSPHWAIAVDSDPHVFRCIVRLLRGYLHGVPVELRGPCRQEAYRLGLHALWDHRYPPAPTYAFHGGGVSHNSRVFTSYVVMSRLGPRVPLAHASQEDPTEKCTSSVTIRVELCELVGMGVVSNAVTDCGNDCRGVEGTAMLYCNGDLHCTPFSCGSASSDVSPTQPMARVQPYAANAVVTMTLDVARGTVLWERPGEHSTVAQLWDYPHNKTVLPEGADVSFAVVCSGKSVVCIEDPAECS